MLSKIFSFRSCIACFSLLSICEVAEAQKSEQLKLSVTIDTFKKICLENKKEVTSDSLKILLAKYGFKKKSNPTTSQDYISSWSNNHSVLTIHRFSSYFPAKQSWQTTCILSSEHELPIDAVKPIVEDHFLDQVKAGKFNYLDMAPNERSKGFVLEVWQWKNEPDGEMVFLQNTRSPDRGAGFSLSVELLQPGERHGTPMRVPPSRIEQ